MAAGIIPVKERLKRMQEANYRSLVTREPKPKSVEDELEEFKKQALIRPANDAESQKKEALNKGIKDEWPCDEEKFRQKEKEIVHKVEQMLDEIESIKKEMMANGNFMKRLYEIKEIEKRLLPILYDAKIMGTGFPKEVKSRILIAAPKAALLD